MVHKILGQAKPGTTETLLYVPRAGKTARVTSLVVANRHASTAQTIRVRVSDVADSTDDDQYLFYDVSIPAADSLVVIGGDLMSFDESQGVFVYASSSDVSFTAMGVEEDK